MRAFTNLTSRWKIEKGHWHVLLGQSSPNTIRNWLETDDRDAVLKADVQERLSHLISIYDGLHRLFGDADYADEWIRIPNKAFGGQPPLERLLAGQFADLYTVRLYVDRALAG